MIFTMFSVLVIMLIGILVAVMSALAAIHYDIEKNSCGKRGCNKDELIRDLACSLKEMMARYRSSVPYGWDERDEIEPKWKRSKESLKKAESFLEEGRRI